MERLLKIVIPLVLAALVAGGYYVYALPKADAGHVLVAATDIQPGQEITKDMLLVAGVSADRAIQSVNPADVVGKRAKEAIKGSEAETSGLCDSRFRPKEDRKQRRE